MLRRVIHKNNVQKDAVVLHDELEKKIAPSRTFRGHKIRLKSLAVLVIFISALLVLWITFKSANSILTSQQEKYLHLNFSKRKFPRIPEYIIMTHKAPDFFQLEEAVKSNAIKTIVRYTEAWQNKHQGLKQEGRNLNRAYSLDSLPSNVWYMNDNDCVECIRRVEADLIPYFLEEPEGKFRADICRIAALYEKGGYYFDTDMEVVRPVIDISPDTTFMSVTSPTLGGSFFQSFMAVAPQHPMLRLNLDLFLEHYRTIGENGDGIFGTLLGPEALNESYVQFSERNEAKFWPSDMGLIEAHLNNPHLYRHGHQYHCKWMVRNETQGLIYFFSRVVGAGPECNH